MSVQLTKSGQGTSNVSIHSARVGDRDIFLIDTPGFDDTHRSDTDILREVADWLNQSYQAKIKLAGIVYLHRIQDNRVGGSGMKNLRMFKQLCGEDGLSCVVLATTMWNSVPRERAEQRERELMTKKEFWAGLIAKGSQVFRQDDGAQSARRIIQHILSRRQRITLRIQEEMAGGKSLRETAAGREVQADIEVIQKKHEKEMALLRREMADAIRSRDIEAKEEIAAIQAELADKMRQAQEDQQRLQVNIEELHRQRDEELRREREEAHARDLEHLRARLESESRLEAMKARNQYETQLFEARLRQQAIEAENERLRNESGGCIIM
ncbi:Reticulocyte-binding protein 2 a [Madurella mycetomatis]|uniref:Reticulocyte-binding protein 2 a n=1 Tax=Madurella mycetomatis TaxID=100816 RepID=A0A175WD20_9PEZI|nr:Reticulocyte-binding protein 2 a [Madurella mycetomatis]